MARQSGGAMIGAGSALLSLTKNATMDLCWLAPFTSRQTITQMPGLRIAVVQIE